MIARANNPTPIHCHSGDDPLFIQISGGYCAFNIVEFNHYGNRR
jgi:hypothetical protein